MAGLPKQNVVVPLGGGLQTDVDDKLCPLGKVIGLTDGYWLRTGEVAKRPGNTALGLGLVGGGSLPQPYGLATHKGALVSLGSPGPTPLAEWSPTRGQWAAATSARRGPLSYSLQQVASAGFSMDVAYANGYLFMIYSDTRPGVVAIWQVAIDVASGARVMTRTVSITGLFGGLRVATTTNGYVTFAYINGANLVMDSFQISALSSTPSTTASTAAVATNKQLDVRAVPTGGALTFCYTVGGNATGIDLDPQFGTLSAPYSVRDSTAAVIPVNGAMGWMKDLGGSGKLALITQHTANGIKVQWDIPTTGVTRQAASTISGGVPASVQSVTGYTTTNSATGVGVVLYDNNSTNVVSSFAFGGGTVTGGPAALARSVLLASKPWTYSGDYFVAVEHPTTGQYTRYVLRAPPDAASVISFALAGQPAPLATVAPQAGTREGTGNNVLSSVAAPASNKFVFGIDVARSTEAALASGGTITGDGIGVALVTVTHGTVTNTTIGGPREAVDGLFMPGGNLGAFDGVQYGLGGFAYFPDQPTLAGAGGGSMTAGATYYYRLVYRYLDAQGRLWRSAPSVIKSIAMGANTSVNLTIPTCRVSDRVLSIEIYRGAANDTVQFTFVSQVANDGTVDTVSFSDLASDTQLANTEPLYTNGGVQQNDVTPGFLSLAVAGNRVFGVSADDPQAIWPSQVFTLNRGLGFSVFNAFDVRDQHGAITGLAAMDDKLVVFKADAIYIVTGDGPDVLGRGAFNVQLIAIGMGCANPQSIVETKEGVMFRSTSTRAGIFLLDRGGSIQYVGGGVQRYNNQIIVGAVMLPSLNHVRFYTSGGLVLVFDLVLQQWAVFVSAIGVGFAAAVPWNGSVASANQVAQVLVEDTSGTIYTDDGNTYGMVVTTPWLSLAQLKGYERFYRFQPVGDVIANSTMQLSLFRDYSTSPLTARTAALLANTTIGAELRHSAAVSTLQIVLAEVPAANAGFRLSAVSLLVAAKQGLRPVAPGSRFT